MIKRKKFSIFLDDYRLAVSENEKASDLNRNECGKDVLKSKSVENMDDRRATGCSATC